MKARGRQLPRVAVLVLGLLAVWLAPITSAGAVEIGHASQGGACIYDAPDYDTLRRVATQESGTPGLGRAPVECRSHGALARLDDTSQPAITAYTHPVVFMQGSGAASTTSGDVVSADQATSSLLRSGVAAKTEMTTLFRSVGPGEAADIAATGTFSNTAGINVKYFATTADDAATWGNFLNPGESTIVTTRVPTSALDGAMFEPRWDGIGPAWILDSAQLGRLNQAMNGISVVR